MTPCRCFANVRSTRLKETIKLTEGTNEVDEVTHDETDQEIKPWHDEAQPLKAPEPENYSHEVKTETVETTTNPQLDNTVYLPDLQAVQLELNSAAREGRDPNLDQFPRGAVVAAGVRVGDDGEYITSQSNETYHNVPQNQPLNPEISGEQSAITNQSGQLNSRPEVSEPYVEPEAETKAEQERVKAEQELRDNGDIPTYQNPETYETQESEVTEGTDIAASGTLNQVENAAAIEANKGVPNSAFQADGQTDAAGNRLDQFGASVPNPTVAADASGQRPGAPNTSDTVQVPGVPDGLSDDEIRAFNAGRGQDVGIVKDADEDQNDPTVPKDQNQQSDKETDHSSGGTVNTGEITEKSDVTDGSADPSGTSSPSVHSEAGSTVEDNGPGDLSNPSHDVMTQESGNDGNPVFKVTKD